MLDERPVRFFRADSHSARAFSTQRGILSLAVVDCDFSLRFGFAKGRCRSAAENGAGRATFKELRVAWDGSGPNSSGGMSVLSAARCVNCLAAFPSAD